MMKMMLGRFFGAWAERAAPARRGNSLRRESIGDRVSGKWVAGVFHKKVLPASIWEMRVPGTLVVRAGGWCRQFPARDEDK
jgi:hypothetical protein